VSPNTIWGGLSPRKIIHIKHKTIAGAGLFFCNKFSQVSDETYFNPINKQKIEIPQKLITENSLGSNGNEDIL
jgi:hypothetical protein